MKTAIFFIYLFSLLLSTVLAFANRKSLRSRFLSILVPYLFYSFLQEVVIYFYLLEWPGGSTAVFYNIYNIVSVPVFAVLYYRIPFNERSRKLIFFLTIASLLIMGVTLSFMFKDAYINGYLSLIAGLIITCFAIIFLFNYFNIDQPIEEKHWRPVVWVTFGIVLFYPVFNIASVFHRHLLSMSATVFGFKLYQLIPQLMSIFMYGCFAYAFHLCKKKN